MCDVHDFFSPAKLGFSISSQRHYEIYPKLMIQLQLLKVRYLVLYNEVEGHARLIALIITPVRH